MLIRRFTVAIVAGLLLVSGTGFAAKRGRRGSGHEEFEGQLNRVINRLNRQAEADVEAPVLLAQLIQREYGTRTEEIRWAASHSVNWGEMVALAYIQAVTDRKS